MKDKSKSMGMELHTADALKRLKRGSIFLGAPERAATLERRSSNVSIHSMDSNVFKRGLESMLSSRRKSTLFEVSLPLAQSLTLTFRRAARLQ